MGIARWQLHMFHVSLNILGGFVGMARFFVIFLHPHCVSLNVQAQDVNIYR